MPHYDFIIYHLCVFVNLLSNMPYVMLPPYESCRNRALFFTKINKDKYVGPKNIQIGFGTA